MADDFEVLSAFLSHVKERPNAVAIETAKVQMTYKQLDSRANALVELLERDGICARSVIPLLLPRGPQLVAVQLAALKLGACFLPIDPDQPAARIAEILKQSRASCYVTSRSDRTPIVPARAIFIQDAPQDATKACRSAERSDVSGLDLAYVIFTSGSTGTPKGVMISRHSMNRFCRDWIARTGLSPGEKSTFLASPGFDTSIDEIWPALASGATLSIPDDESRFSPALLSTWIIERAVTVCDAPTAVAELLLERPWHKASLRVLIAGGDRLTRYPPADLPFRFLNAYGPTEHTVVSTVEEVAFSHATANPPIGFPISDTEVYIVDENFRALPPGEIGEIVISGAGLARGYLNSPEQTADKFVPNPFSQAAGARCYRTGDAGSKDANGRVFFHGRTDAQVSIRGNRVEPGEVSATLKKNPYVEDAFVTVLKGPSDAKLVAYYVPRDRSYTPTQKDLSDYMREFLPSYMIPDHFVVIGKLPLSTNGKVDPRLLPIPSCLSRRSSDIKPPANEAQSIILSLWKKALGLDHIGVDENFFDLGGNSLAAIRIITDLSDSFGTPVSLKQFYQTPTIASLEASRRSWSSLPAPKIETGPNAPCYELSFQQEQVVFFQSLEPSSNAYHSQSTIRIKGALDVGILVEALNAITERHELLRTTYSLIGRETVQVVHARFRLDLPVFDLSLSLERSRERDELVGRLLGTVFDLSQLPLARWTLIKLSEEEHDLVLVEHHIVHDGWTLSIIFRELQHIYQALLDKRPAHLPKLPIQYRDFAAWQRKHIDGEYFASQLEYWKKELAGAPRTTLVPYDFPRPKKQTFRGDLISLDLPEHLSTRMKEFARVNRFTFFELMFSVFSLLVHRVSQQDDICIGSALANRERPEVAGLIGMFVNVVVIRSTMTHKMGFADYVRMIKSKIVEANMNQAYPFPKLIQKLNYPRDSAVNPLFQLMFSFHDSEVVDPMLGDASCYIDHFHGNSSAKQDLDVVVIPRGARNRGADSEIDERISMIWEFNRDLFTPATVQRLIGQYLHVLETCLADSGCVVNGIDILPREEASRILELSAQTSTLSVDVLSRIGQQLNARPDAPCVVEQGADGKVHTYSYGDLRRCADDIRRRIARSSAHGQREEEVIAILLPRGFLHIASQLAVLECGKAFVPIDPATPRGRVETLMNEARVSLAIAGTRQRELIPSAISSIVLSASDLRVLDDSTAVTDRNPQSLSYVIFTSGSTGTPKGVAVSTSALYGYVARVISDFKLSSESRVLVYNSPGFDTSLGDIWPALTAGATLFVPPEGVRYSADELIQYITSNRITFADVPTAMVERMIASQWPASHCLETLLVGGEKLRSRPSESHRFRLHNEYGPTETTISATSGLVAAGADASSPDIGRPVAGRGCLVLDSDLRLAPIGVEGDLYVYGEGLARGYWHDPALTAERFVPNPYDTHGGRMYRTGDVAKWTAAGTLQFCGRRDRQVKIHGFRIELGEISARVKEVAGVAAAHTLVRDLPSGKKEIVSFYVTNEERSIEAAIRDHLRDYLPGYMVPSQLARVLEIPVTLGGKVDERRLLTSIVSAVSSARSSEHCTPNPIEERLRQIWCTLLKLESVQIDQNFFELGGHSLLLAELQRAIEEEFNQRIPLVEFFEFSRIESLAARLTQASGESGSQRARAPKANLLARRSAAAKRR